MFLFLAEVALFALLPFIQEPTASQSVRRETQPAQTLLEHFFDQHYRHRDRESEEVTETVSGRSAIKLNVASSTRNALFPSSPTSSLAMKEPIIATNARMLAIPPRMEFRNRGDPRMSSRMSFDTVPAAKPQDTEDFVFAPSSGSFGGVPNGGSMIFAPSPSRPTCPSRCEKPEHQTCFNSKCYELLKQGPCNPGEWLIEKNGQGKCAKSNCQYPKLPFNDRCFTEIELKQKLCLPDQSIALSRDGTYECDCTGRDIYDPQSNRCYEAYKQGPCGRSQYFILTPDMRSISEWKPACVHNPCHSQTGDDQMICYGPHCPHQGKCVKPGTSCTTNAPSNGNNGVWSVNDDTKMLTCEDTATRHIGNVPTFSCGKGSKRDRTGKCRKVSSVDFS